MAPDFGLHCLPITLYGTLGKNKLIYRVRPNNRTVRLGFSKLLGTLSCVKTCIDLLRVHYKKDQKRTFDDDYAISFLIFFMNAYIVGTHLNCIDLSMQFK